MAGDLESAEDIRKATDRLLRKADAFGVYPTPVDQIIEAAGLTEADDDLFEDETVRSLPKKFQSALLNIKTKVLAALDRREKIIYVNKTEGNKGSQSFRRLHEVSHNIFPWQQDLVNVDDHSTLSPSVRQLFEREANQGAAELIFQREHFTRVSHDYKVSVLSVIELHTKFGSSIHAAFRRYIESHSGSLYGIVLKSRSASNSSEDFERNEIVQSSRWVEQFGDCSNLKKILSASKTELARCAVAAQSAPCEVVEGAAQRTDMSGRVRKLKIEAFFNHYAILVLAWDPKSHMGIRAKRRIEIV